MVRWIALAFGCVLVLLGLACLNYTKAGTIQHHQEWAAASGMPAPSATILWAGAASGALGAFLVGFSAAKLKRTCAVDPAD